MFEVTVHERGAEPIVLRFSKPEITIGRVRGNDVVLARNSVSKRHAKIISKNGKFIAVDLKSTNGTIVSGRKISAPQVLRDDDRVIVGDYVLSFDAADGDAVQAVLDSTQQPAAPAEDASGPAIDDSTSPPDGGVDEPKGPDAPPVTLGGSGAAPADFRPTEPAAPLKRPQEAAASSSTMMIRVPSDLLKDSPTGSVERVGGERIDPGMLANADFVAAHAKCIEMLSAEAKELPMAYPPREDDAAGFRAKAEAWAADIADLSTELRELLIRTLVHEATGLGPLEFYLDDPNVSEVHVNRHDAVFARRNGVLERMPLGFGSRATLDAAAQRIMVGGDIADPLGGSVRMPDGTRIELVMPPAAANEPVITLKKPARPAASMDELIADGFLSQGIADALVIAATHGGTMLVASQNPADGSTLLNALLNSLPGSLRVVTVEAAPTLAPGSDSVVRLEHTKVGEMSSVARALLLEPEVLAVDPLGQRSAADWLDGASSQECATLATLAARSPTDALARLVIHALEGRRAESSAVRRQITANLDLIVHIRRQSDGTALVGEVVEVTTNERGELQTSSVFRSKNGPGGMEFAASGHVPSFFATLSEAGESFDGSMFNA